MAEKDLILKEKLVFNGIFDAVFLESLGSPVQIVRFDKGWVVLLQNKETTREMLTNEKIEKNMQGWKEQAAQLIDFEGENAMRRFIYFFLNEMLPAYQFHPD